MKSKYKKLLQAIVFVAIFICAFIFINEIFKIKSEAVIEFYRQKKDPPIDVLFVGSSHVYYAINPAVVWQEQAITSYVLGASAQPMWNSYYFIKEALKYQKIKVVVLDVFIALRDEEFQEVGFIAENTLSLKFSQDKIDALKASAPKDMWFDFIVALGFPVSHIREYENISTKNDLGFLLGRKDFYMKGYLPHYKVSPESLLDLSDVKEFGEIPKKQLDYLMKIIDLTKEKNVKLVLIVLPYVSTKEEQKIYNSIEKIAKENSLEFLNYNLLYKKTNFDPKTDINDPAHLNNDGASKISKDIAQRLHNLYGLSVDKNSSKYNSWNTWADEVMLRTQRKQMN